MSRIPERSAPPVSWSGVLAGAALAVAVSLVGGALRVPLVAVPAGGFLAGRIAGAAGLLQGAAVAVVFIVVQAVLASLGPAGTADLVADTAATIGHDVLLLALGASGGWLATRS